MAMRMTAVSVTASEVEVGVLAGNQQYRVCIMIRGLTSTIWGYKSKRGCWYRCCSRWRPWWRGSPMVEPRSRHHCNKTLATESARGSVEHNQATAH